MTELRRDAGSTLLRLHTCGGAGDGKSALVARLLDELHAPLDDGHQEGSTGELAYRSFSTGRRRFIVADVPGHERYMPSLVTGASTADLSVVLVDARTGVRPETRHHSVLASLLGVRQVVLAVSKMDLVGYSQAAFTRIEEDYRSFAAPLGLTAVAGIPVSATAGDNLVQLSAATPWYRGPALIDLLEGAEAGATHLLAQPLRLRIESVKPAGGPGPHGVDLHGYAGTIVAGRLRKGDSVRIQPSGHLSRVSRIVTGDGELDEAIVGQSIAVALEDQIDVSLGDLIVPAAQPAEVSDQFEATVIWMNDTPLLPGRSYSLKIGAKPVTATINPLKYKLNPSNLQRLAAAKLDRNEIGVCNLHLDRPIAFDPYRVNRATGGFTLVDRLSGDEVGAGLLHFALRRAQNVHWQALDVNKGARAAIKRQRACVLWYTGLSGAGKSTIANLVDKRLHSMSRHTYLLDGDNVRHGLNKDLGFTDADRVENIRRIAEVAKLMVDAGLIVGTAFISPFRAERQTARALLSPGEFIEIHVDTPLDIAEGRDPKGLYKKARRGDLKNFTGIDSPYEAPQNPEIRIDTTTTSPEEAAQMIVTYLEKRGMFGPD